MEIKKNIVLLGMMGSGKSTIGSLIAKKLNVVLIDIDKKIEKMQNQRISQIFEQRGEAYFRELVDNRNIVEEALEKIEPLQPKEELVPEPNENNTKDGDS